jgi:hypothetical protein
MGVCAQEVSETRERFRQKTLKCHEGWFYHTRRTLDSQASLSLPTPRRELREAKEDGIERKDSMYDVEQSSRRNKSIVISANQRVCIRWLQLRHRRIHMQSAAFHLRLYLGFGFSFSFCLGFYFCFCGSLGNLDPCDARVRGCVCSCALAVTSIAGLGLFTGRVGGSVGGFRRSILIVDRLYYRIIRLGLFFLGLSLFRFAFLFLLFLLLYNKGHRSAPDTLA